MDHQGKKNELIVKTTLELLQNVLPTNIMSNLEQLDAISDSDGNEFANDLDEERFFFENLLQNSNQPTDASTLTPTTADAEATIQEPQFVAVPEFNDNGEQIDNNSSLTYFEIVEREMMQSIPVTTNSIAILSQILSEFPEVNADFLSEFNLQSAEQLTNLLVYALMSGEMSHQIEQTMFLESGTVNQVLEIMCEIIADKKNAFIQWPNDDEILQNVRYFERLLSADNDQFAFQNVFGAIGTVEIRIKPALPTFYTIPLPSCSSHTTNPTYTPIKWQCSCDTNGFLQSSFVFVPQKENQSKNSYVFEVNPVKWVLNSRRANELYMVADETLTAFSFLLTPHEKRMIDADAFNKALQAKRIVIDRAFEKIKRRFPLLERIEHRNANCICNIIETIGILHNFFLIHRDSLYV